MELETYQLKNALSVCLRHHNFNSNLSDLSLYVDKLISKYNNDNNLIIALNNFRNELNSNSYNRDINIYLRNLEGYLNNVHNIELIIDLISYFDIQFVNQMLIIRKQNLLLDQLKIYEQTIQHLCQEINLIKQDNATNSQNLSSLSNNVETISQYIKSTPTNKKNKK